MSCFGPSADRCDWELIRAPGGGAIGPPKSGSSVLTINPFVEASPQLSKHAGVIVVVDAIPTFAWVEEQVVERLAGDGAGRPAALEIGILARAVVAVGQHRIGAIVEPPDVEVTRMGRRLSTRLEVLLWVPSDPGARQEPAEVRASTALRGTDDIRVARPLDHERLSGHLHKPDRDYGLMIAALLPGCCDAVLDAFVDRFS